MTDTTNDTALFLTPSMQVLAVDLDTGLVCRAVKLTFTFDAQKVRRFLFELGVEFYVGRDECAGNGWGANSAYVHPKHADALTKLEQAIADVEAAATKVNGGLTSRGAA